MPDVAVGRIPADSPDELAAVVRKVLRYEQQADQGSWRRQIDVVAGVGGFGVMTDALIEAAARNVFRQVVPAELHGPAIEDRSGPDLCADQRRFVRLDLSRARPADDDRRGRDAARARGRSWRSATCRGCAAARTVRWRCWWLVTPARSTPATTRWPRSCLLDEQGPVAAIAATRVTMPYGNTVLGCELLRAAFAKPGATLGDVWLRAQRQTLADSPADDSLRTSLDSLARGVSPPPVDLAAERREHVLLYQLLGDPLLRLNYPQARRRSQRPGSPPSPRRARASK